MAKLTAKETVELLKEVFKQDFGGKENGRYKISIERLLHLTGHQVLSLAFITELMEEAIDEGIILINTGASYSVIEMSIVRGYRNVPPSVISNLLLKNT